MEKFHDGKGRVPVFDKIFGNIIGYETKNNHEVTLFPKNVITIERKTFDTNNELIDYEASWFDEHNVRNYL